MLHVCCVKHGTKYGPEYVNILYDMVRRNISAGTPGRFVCFTDDPSGLSEGIETEALPEGVVGWWGKVYLFSKDAFPAGDRVIYFDLDVVITGLLDPLVEYSGELAMLQDRGIPGMFNSTIMLWEAGKLHEIWARWEEEGRPDILGGDQVWIQKTLKERVFKTPDFVQELFPGKFFSFKLECFDKSVPPKGAMVVYFHGEPRPHQCEVEWVKNTWKIGGGTADDLLMICNVAEEKLKDNIRAACKRAVPWIKQLPPHSLHAVIVGGAPSLKTKLEELRERQASGQHIFATNNTYQFLLGQGIKADFHIICDAQEHNAEFVTGEPTQTFLASQCHPAVWEAAAARGDASTLWHCYVPELEDAISNPEQKPFCLIACGSTVGLNAMGIAYTLGYRVLHIYGMDSCYESKEGEHHAYAQKSNDGEPVLEANCYGRCFWAAPWMIHQANQFQELAFQLVQDDCEIVTHGTGLIPWIALNTQQAMMRDTEIEEKEGIYWPSRDVSMQANYKPALHHIEALLEKVATRRVAVQAGGNVGIWPREFAKHFENVVTFEPDELNFRCLKLNCQAGNVRAYNAALGDRPGRKGLCRLADNCGGHTIAEGDEFDVMTIDSLELPYCDLIQLDIEGYELLALKGAEETIKRCKPVICIEQNGISAKLHGLKDSDLTEWLLDRGYIGVMRFGRDIVFINSEGKETCKHITDTCLEQTEDLRGSQHCSSGILA